MIEWALTVGRARKLAAARPRAIELLTSPSPLRDAAAGYLVALGDPGAVAALARAARFDEPPFLHTVIEAVAALGGEEARDFLEFVAGGHGDDDVRQHAREGLQRLERTTDRDAGVP